MKFNPVQALQSLLSPLDKLTAVSEAELMLTQDIHKVLTVDLKSAANDMASELSTQTSILKDIKSLIKDQIKESKNRSNNSGRDERVESSGGFKPMSMKDTGLTAVMIIGVAAALVSAAGIFMFMPVLNPMQLLSALAVAATVALVAPVFVKIADVLGKNQGLINASYGGFSGSKPDTSNMFSIMGATLLTMVGISVALVLSGAILSFMPVIGAGQFLTALAIGLIMIPSAYAFVLFAKTIKDNKLGVKDMGMVVLSFLGVAAGIVGTALIFQMLPDKYKAPDLLWSLQVGFAVALFSVSFFLIMKAVQGASLKQIMFGSLAIGAIALGIVGLSYAFQYLPDGKYKAPDMTWSLVAGTTVALFAVSFYFVMKAVKGASPQELLYGAIAIPLIAIAIAGVAWVFSQAAESLSGLKGPDPIETLKAGLAILVFAIPFALLAMVFQKFGVGPKEALLGVLGTVATAIAILAISYIFSALPDAFKTPPLSWTMDAALAIGVFAGVIGVIGAVIALSGGTGEAALIAGVIGVVTIAAGIWAVAWILSKVPTEFVGGMQALTIGMMAPVNGMINAFTRLKNEIGIENLPALAGGIVLLAGAWLTLVGALAGQAIGGLGASIANLGKSIIDGISSFFGGEKTKSPIDLLDMILNRANAITTISKPMETVATSFGKIAGYTGGVVKGLGAWSIFIEEANAENLTKSANASEKIANAYTKFAKAANGLNIKAVQASTAMFTSIANLSKPDAQNAMKTLTQELLKAVEELSKTVVNLETAVEKQGDSNSGLIEETGKAIGGFVEKVTGMVTSTDTKVDKSIPKTPEQQKAEQAKAADNTALSKDIASLTQALNMLVQKFNDTTGTNAPYVRVAQ